MVVYIFRKYKTLKFNTFLLHHVIYDNNDLSKEKGTLIRDKIRTEDIMSEICTIYIIFLHSDISKLYVRIRAVYSVNA